MLASTIMRHEAQLRQVSAQIREANSIIEQAKKGCEAAAEKLGAKWAGDARDAFMAEQVKAKTWIEQMIQIVHEMVSTLDQVLSKYNAVEESVSNLIKNK